MSKPVQLSLGLDGLEPIAASHVTHQGGRGEPFHDWYPYLEGFSSEFVKFILSKYMPGATKVLEPFAGTGTTPVVLSELGIDCGYCEVNPAMRLVVEAKMAVGLSDVERRRALSERLHQMSDALDEHVRKAIPDSALQHDYRVNFGESVFFDDGALAEVLALRTVNDEVTKEDTLLGDLFAISVMSKLVTCSRLKRAGDVRYKTEKELAKGVPNIVVEVAQHLKLIAVDCVTAPNLSGKSSLLTPNARNLQQSSAFQADGVITSPPYLNGTNYFRNTKLELWLFAR